MLSVAVLFARSDSIYKSLPGTDVYDVDRDACCYSGPLPVVAHPPCRAWGRLRAFAKPRPGERDLAVLAVDRVRRFGGVLEHPAFSQLWSVERLPRPGEGRDDFGGWTLPIYQGHAGHRAPKPTWLYVVGCEPSQLPGVPFGLGLPPGRVELMARDEREATPQGFAEWLLEVARRTRCCAPVEPERLVTLVRSVSF